VLLLGDVEGGLDERRSLDAREEEAVASATSEMVLFAVSDPRALPAVRLVSDRHRYPRTRILGRLLEGSVSQGVRRRAHRDALIVHPSQGTDSPTFKLLRAYPGRA
jgi:hypothetical protein